jgi:uncharacterized protein involved in type VI secretion and phage assembly
MKTEPLSIRFHAEQQGYTIDLSVKRLQYTAKTHAEYEIDIDVIDGDGSQSTFDTSPAATANQWAKVMVSFHKTGKSMCLQGSVYSIEVVPYFSQRQRILRMKLRSELWRTFSRHRSGIYYAPVLSDILNKGIKDQAQRDNATNYTDFQWSINTSDSAQYPQHFQLSQYGESDGDFLSRTILRHGAWFNFYQPLSSSLQDTSSKVMLMVGDNNNTFLRYEDRIIRLQDEDMQGDGVYEVITQSSAKAGKARAIYFDENSGTTLTSTYTIRNGHYSQLTTDVKVPFNNANQAQVDTYAQHAAYGETLRMTEITGKFQGHLIQAGNVIDIDLDRYGIRGDCIVTDVCYRFDAQEDKEALVYQQTHTFVAYPLTVPYRERLINHNANLPIYTGTLSAVFAETDGKDTVTPDDQGRIPLKFPFDYSYFCNGPKARYTRLCSRLNSGKAGLSFPYYADTEFQVSFADGCVDRPLIMGTAATDQTNHIHNPELQQRTAHVLPQGQEMTYTNTLGNTTAMKFGTKHQEGDHHSFMMLNNYPSQTRTGDKHLDFVQATTANHEHQITGNLTEKFGGNKVQGAFDQGVPSTSVPIADKELSVGEFTDGPYTVTTSGSVGGKLKIVNKHAALAVEMDKDQMSIDAQQEGDKVFAGLTIQKIDGDLVTNPTITIGNQFGSYSIQCTTGMRYKDLITLSVSHEKEAVLSDNMDWKISGNVEFSLNITATRTDDDADPNKTQSATGTYFENLKTKLIGIVVTGSDVAAMVGRKTGVIYDEAAPVAANDAEATAAEIENAIGIFYEYETPVAETIMGMAA